MTIGEYRSKLQTDLQQAASIKNYCLCRELVGMLELLDGLAPETPARFLTFSEIVDIECAIVNLGEELKKKRRLPGDEPFRVGYKFYALAEAYKLRDEKKSIADIARLVRAAFPARHVPSRTTKRSVLTIGEYRKKIMKDFEKTVKKDRWHAGNFSALLELIHDVRGETPAHLLTFSDILQIGSAAQDMAGDLYKKGEITSASRWTVMFRHFALAEGFALRGEPISLEKLGVDVRSRLQKDGLKL